MIRWTTFLERPARGGSTTTTSGRPARSSSSRRARRVSPAKKWALVTSLRRAPAIASATASLDELDPPQLARARRERERDRADAAVEVVHPLPALERGVLARRRRRAPRPSRCSSGRTPRGRSAGRARRGARAARASPHTSSVSPPAVVSARLSRARPQDAAESESPSALAQRRGERARLELAVGRDEPDLQRAGAPAFAHDEVAQPRATVRLPAPATLARGARPAARAGDRAPRPCRPCSRHQRSATSRAWLPRSEASRQSLDRRHPVAAGGGVEAAHQLAVRRSPKEYSSLLR